jgi:transcriptional regulator with XRE-family HTH domain
MRLGLKAKILQQGISQRELGRRSNIPENRLSTIIHGWVNPTPQERAALASVLKADESLLFGADTLNDARQSAVGFFAGRARLRRSATRSAHT